MTNTETPVPLNSPMPFTSPDGWRRIMAATPVAPECVHCGEAIFQRTDGTWTTVYVNSADPDVCIQVDARREHEPNTRG